MSTEAATIATQHFIDSLETKRLAAEQLPETITSAAAMMTNSLLNGGKILTCGNGGSSGDASHLACELVNRLEMERPALPAMALTVDAQTVTAIANDYHFDRIFERQINAFGRQGDILIAFTTSGNSSNILTAVKTAQQIGMPVIAITGKNGGKLRELLSENDLEVCVPSERTMRIQEIHLVIIHILCDLIDKSLFGGLSL